MTNPASPAGLPAFEAVQANLGMSVAHRRALMLMVVLIVAAPFLLYQAFLMKLLCFALFACAFNLLSGHVGLLSFGHAAFFGMGSYVTAWVIKAVPVSTEVAILAGGLSGVALGALFGAIAIRRQGLFFAMITLGLAQIVYFFCLQAPFTNGEDGIQKVPRGNLFGLISLNDDRVMYAVVAGIFLLGFGLIYRVAHSPFGQVLKGIRENETRVRSLGYEVDRYKLVGFIISAGLAGVAGGTKAIVFGLATLSDVNFMVSGEVLLMALLGGFGTVFGPVVGAAVTILVEYYVGPLGAWFMVTQGLIFIFCVLAFPRGIIGELGHRLKVPL